MKHTKGALARIAQSCAELDYNVVNAECVRSGEKHATWSAILESPGTSIDGESDYRSRFKQLRPGDWQGSLELGTAIADDMYQRLEALETSLARGCKKWLHPRILKGQQYVFDADRVGAKTRKRFRPRAIQLEWLQNMAHFGLFGIGHDRPLFCEYDRSLGLLRFRENYRDLLDRLGQRLGELKPGKPPGADPLPAELPTRAIATCDPREHYVRLTPLPRRMIRSHLIRVSVDYASSRPARGLLSQVSETLSAEGGVNLVHVSNQIIRHTNQDEGGRLFLIGESDRELQVEDLERLRIKVNETKTSHVTRCHTEIAGADVIPLFVSMRFQFPRQREVVELLEEVGAEYGFRASVYWNPAIAVTPDVLSAIRKAEAFLQVLMFRSGEDTENPRLTWLDFEYGAAACKDLPRVRLVDTLHQSFDWWKARLTTDGDRWPIHFSSDSDSAVLRESFKAAIHALREQITRYSAPATRNL